MAPLRADEHLLGPIIARAERDPSLVVASYREGPVFVDVTAGEFLERVRALAKGLIASRIQAGDRVVIMSRTRLEWLQADYAILAVGATTVPIYETSSAAQVKHIVVDSGAILALVETDEVLAMVDAIDEARHSARPWSSTMVASTSWSRRVVPSPIANSTTVSPRSPSATLPRSSTPPEPPGCRRDAY